VPDRAPSESSLTLTFAELEFLLGEEPSWPQVRAALNGEAPDSRQVPAAGAMSLIVRGLAAVEPDGHIVSDQAVHDLATSLTRSPHPVGISVLQGDMVAIAVYCPQPDAGRRTQVVIGLPGLVQFRPLPSETAVVDQALEVVAKAAAVDGGMVIVKVLGVEGFLFRHSGDTWELGNPSRDPSDVDSYFEPSTRQAAFAAARDYLARHLADLG